MKQNKLSFKSENLEVDWISLNLKGLMDPRIITGRLLKYFTPHVLIDDVPSIGFHGLKKKYKVSIRQYTGSKGYWVGTKIIFSGKDAAYFYKLIQTQRFDWDLLKFDEHSLSLGRIDVCYDRELNSTDRDPHLFLENSCQTINEKNDKQQAKMSKSGNILWIGKRSSSNFFRGYLKPGRKKIRFEIEVKKDEVKKFQHDFFTGQFERFEELLTEHFYHQATRLFDLENSYCDWLRYSFRRVRKLPSEEVLVNSLSTSFLTGKPENDLVKLEFVYRLIQLVNYMKSFRKWYEILPIFYGAFCTTFKIKNRQNTHQKITI